MNDDSCPKADRGEGHPDARQEPTHPAITTADLHHRIRNLLAHIRGIVSGSTDDGDVESFRGHIMGRLDALARVQSALMCGHGQQINLEMILLNELSPQAINRGLVELSGPDVKLSAKNAEVFALAIHELATNAIKFGALAHPRGRVKIVWQVVQRGALDWLEFTWRESNVPIVDLSPELRGFGTELIKKRIPYELRGEGRIELTPNGIHSEIRFPLADRGSDY